MDCSINNGLARVHEWTKYPVVGCVPSILIAVAGVVMMAVGPVFGLLLALPSAFSDNCASLFNKCFEMVPEGLFWTATGLVEVVGNLFGTISQWLQFCEQSF